MTLKPGLGGSRGVGAETCCNIRASGLVRDAGAGRVPKATSETGGSEEETSIKVWASSR